MINIVICDDDMAVRNALEIMMLEIDPNLHIFSFQSANQMDFELPDAQPVDALFMDIQFSPDPDAPENGIDFAYRFHLKHRDAKIFFISGFIQNYVSAIFLKYPDLKPAGILSKPFRQDDVAKFLNLLKMTPEQPDALQFRKRDKSIIWIDFIDILYISSFNRMVEVVTTGQKKHQGYAKISEMETRLPENFLRCHRDFIINALHVSVIQNKFVVIGGEQIPLSTFRGVSLHERKKQICDIKAKYYESQHPSASNLRSTI